MFIAGRCYLDGAGTEKNADEAMKWFNKAAKAGNQASARILNQMKKQQKAE
jgi:TPR repeat protein